MIFIDNYSFCSYILSNNYVEVNIM